MIADELGTNGLKKGFVFSFDAYVAFALTIVVIYGMFMFITYPHSYYYEFEQTYALAIDMVNTMKIAAPVGGSYLSYNQMLAQDIISGTNNVCGELRLIVPSQYAFEINGGPLGTVCSEASEYDPDITCDTYRKVKVTVPLILTNYGTFPDKGYNPFGYRTCEGDPEVAGEELTPCDITYSTYYPGDIVMDIVNVSLCI